MIHDVDLAWTGNFQGLVGCSGTTVSTCMATEKEKKERKKMEHSMHDGRERLGGFLDTDDNVIV